jgi:CRISPR-associated protein (TIGR03984 family)
VFEARVFDGAAELRWYHERDGRGAAVVLCEDPAAARRFPRRLDDLVAIDRIDNRYLLWGRPLPAGAAAAPAGWALLGEARVAPLAVPVDGASPGRGEYVFLDSVEYVGVNDDGNAAVVEERLTRLVVGARGSAPARGPAQPSGDRP